MDKFNKDFLLKRQKIKNKDEALSEIQSHLYIDKK